MTKILINEHNLKNNEIEEFSTKARAILIDENEQILIANYADVILLPGGKVDEGETISNAIIRELKEEIGQNYQTEELNFFATMNYYQKEYPKRDGMFQNRLVQTHYFIGPYKNMKKEGQKLTEKEQKSKFRLELVLLENLEELVLNNESINPRNVYFQKELLIILENYKKTKNEKKVKKLELK